MSNVEKYLDYQNKWSMAAIAGDERTETYYSKLGLELRDNFTKSDWDQLISQSSGREKYEYMRMMKEKFPE